jgi:TolB protein
MSSFPRDRRRARTAAGAACSLAIVAGLACDAFSSPPGGRPGAGHEALLVYEQGKGDARDLYVIPVEGGAPRRLTTDPAQDGLPRWTADGRSVVFTSRRSGNWQLWSVPAEGGAPKRLRTNAYTEWQADESPDGRTLAFLSNAEGPEFLWLLDRSTGHLRALVRHRRRAILGNPDWSPEGDRIVFSSNQRQGHQIYVVDVASGEEKRVSPVGGCEPRFSPDGRKIVYVGRRPRKEESRILEHDLATGEERVLVDWPALNYDPAWSPDGSEIAFASTLTGSWEIYRQRLSDGRAWRVTFDGKDARYPDYRPLALPRGRP